MLIRALPTIRRRVPGAALLLVSGGPYREKLARLAREQGVEQDVVFTGSVPWAELPEHYAAGDVYAMPCRTRAAGLDVEGLGIVYLEASATGLPVIGGDSGGAPDAVRDGETGHVVGGRDLPTLTARLVDLLSDPARARAMGAAGRAWVESEWRWETQAARLTNLLDPAALGAGVSGAGVSGAGVSGPAVSDLAVSDLAALDLAAGDPSALDPSARDRSSLLDPPPDEPPSPRPLPETA
jgi:phosphatidylinositol alpha-1,6-mannosyltransferase